MPIWGITDVWGQNGRGKVNQSTHSHYDIGMDLHYANGLYRPTTVTVDVSHNDVKSVLDQMNHKLHSPVFCVPNKF